MKGAGEAEPQAIGEAVNGFGQLEPRQVTLHQWRVLSYRNGDLTAHEVHIQELTCSCEDMEFNCEGAEVCDHLAVALHHASRQLDVGEAIRHDQHQLMVELEEHVRAIERRATGIDAEAAADPDASTSDDSTGTETGFSGDPVEYMESYLRDAGLDPADFDIWIDDEYGSLQVEQTGYLDDDEFSTWVDLTDDLGMSYDGDNNFLEASRFGEVFGS